MTTATPPNYHLILRFHPFLVDPRLTVGDVLVAAFRLDIPMSPRRWPNEREGQAIRDELLRGVATGEYGASSDEDDDE